MPPPVVELIPWADAHQKADVMAKLLDDEQKTSLLLGTGYELIQGKLQLRNGFFEQNTVPIPSLNIPSLTMHDPFDSANPHYDDLMKHMTSWPSPLAMAATWNMELVHEYGLQMATELLGKGARVMLGPNIETHRVTMDGFNVLKIAGEDPHLGCSMVFAFLSGVHSMGLVTAPRYFPPPWKPLAKNSVDTIRILHEYNYPLVKAAIEAGSGIFVCGKRSDQMTFHPCGDKEITFQSSPVLPAHFPYYGYA